MGELEDIIAEQKADIKTGDYQPGEPGVVHYASYIYEGGIEAFIDMTRKQLNRNMECPYHGLKDMVIQPGSYTGYRCRGCTNEATKRYRATPKGRLSARRANRKWAKANREKTREANRRSYHKRMQDPEYAERKRAQARERRRRYRAARKEASNG